MSQLEGGKKGMDTTKRAINGRQPESSRQDLEDRLSHSKQSSLPAPRLRLVPSSALLPCAVPK